MGSARVSDGCAWAPKVAVQDEHGRSDWPAENNFAVATNAFVCEDAMSTFLDPVDDVLAATRPEEAHSDTEQSFVDSEMTADGAAMKNIEDETAQGRRYNDE